MRNCRGMSASLLPQPACVNIRTDPFMSGARVSLLVGVVGALVSLIIRVLWGAIAGYAGGLTDAVLMRIVDVLYSLPTIIFVIVLITTFGELIKQSHFVKNSPALEGGLRVMLLIVFPGGVLVTKLLALNFLGDGLRDAWDVKGRG